MKRRLYSRSTVLLLALATGSAWADTEDTRASAAARYETERAMCLRGESTQDRETCLREAAAAYAQAKRGRATPNEDEAQFEANRLLRCQPLPADQRRDCIARMHGEGTISGSVAEGGIYRELVTIVPAGEDARSDAKR